jgi:ElaB/YqjD/DUF883 family membrane-anchored ribosome-binding protein
MIDMKVSNEATAAAGQSTEHLRDAARAAADGFRQAAEGLRGATRAAGEELSEAGAAAARGASDLWDQAGDAIRKNPMAAFGVAFAAGLVISRLLRR